MNRRKIHFFIHLFSLFLVNGSFFKIQGGKWNRICIGFQLFQCQTGCLLFRHFLVSSRRSGQNMIIWIQNTHGKDTIMRWSNHCNFLITRRNMIECLKLTKKLILVIGILDNNLNKINMLLDNLNEEIIALLKTPSYVLLLQIKRTKPRLKH